MTKPRVLVLTAAGKTGLPIASQLLEEGFPVTAFVHREDRRSAHLKSKGADIVAGSLSDIDDMRRAMKGVQRAYFCTPLGPSHLTGAAVFTAVAAEQPLESLVAMSQWLSHPSHPAPHTRETWLGDSLLALLRTTAVTTINVGFFADNDLQALPFAAQFGLMTLPYGSGLNAAPSNEDIARVAAEILARPEGHAGQTYRPTGPELLSGHDIATVVGKVLGRRVRYVDAPIWLFSKVMRQMGMSDAFIAHFQQYALEYQRGTFAVNAPTQVVRAVTGRDAEDYETVARRYVQQVPDATRSLGNMLKYAAMMNLWMFRPGPSTAQHLRSGDFSDPAHSRLSIDSAEWQRSHTHDALPEPGGAATSPGREMAAPCQPPDWGRR
ncbi:NmrA family NAD(P)-binding protein [Deinococcus sp.]|uniref:NmrA family NAD(P)-binding protein n=1 Tax=Deinococcus sp. TaxID=47478 RepID=UPI003CC6AA3B